MSHDGPTLADLDAILREHYEPAIAAEEQRQADADALVASYGYRPIEAEVRWMERTREILEAHSQREAGAAARVAAAAAKRQRKAAARRAQADKTYAGLSRLIAEGVTALSDDNTSAWMSTTDETPLPLTRDDWQQIYNEVRMGYRLDRQSNRKITDEPIT
jgi:hypothetical protein